MKRTVHDFAGLTTRILEPSAGDVTTTMVLLHGFGAPGDDLVALADALQGPGGSAPVRFVFPEAPLELGGLYGDARAWWLLDLARLEADLRRGVPRDRRDEVPEGLPEVRAQMIQLVDELVATLPTPRLILGGFSQGAMLALDVALHRARRPDGLVLLSGTLLAESTWAPRFGVLSGVPILMSHGRADALLPFAVAEVLRDKLREAGATVDWHEFAGGHEIPMPVLAAITKFLAR